VDSQRLSYTQIQHDLLASTGDSIRPHISVQSLHLRTLSTTAIAQSTEDLTCLSCAKLESCRALRLQTGNRTTKLQHSFHLIHHLTLVDQVLQPVVRGFDLACHVREFQSNHWVVNEALPKRLALVRILDAFLVTDSSKSQALDDDTDPLVVEVRHDHLEALVLLANEVFDRDLDIFEGDVCGATAPDTLAVHLARRYTTGRAFDQEHGNAVHSFASSPHSGGEVVGPDTVRDPLLLAIYDVVFAVFGELGFACQVRHVATGIYRSISSCL
jgi:hypothetical protein